MINVMQALVSGGFDWFRNLPVIIREPAVKNNQELDRDTRIFMGVSIALFMLYVTLFFSNLERNPLWINVINASYQIFFCSVYSIGSISKANRLAFRYDWWRVFMGYDFVIPVMVHDSHTNITSNFGLRERVIWAAENLKPTHYQFRGFSATYEEPTVLSGNVLTDAFDPIDFSVLRRQDALTYKLTFGSN